MKLSLRVFIAIGFAAGSLPSALLAAPAPQAVIPGESTLEQHAAHLSIPKIEFREASVAEALSFLAQRSRNLDKDGPGVNIILKKNGSFAAPPVVVKGIPGLDAPAAQPAPVAVVSDTRLTLTLNNVPMTEALKYVTGLANCSLRWDERAVVISEPQPGVAGAPKAEARRAVKITPEKNGEKLLAALAGQKLPKVDFRDASIREAGEFLIQRQKALAPDGPALNIVFKLEEGKPTRPITFSASDLSILDALRYAAELADMEVTAEEFAITLSPMAGKK